MRIGVLGSGTVGRTLGLGFAETGHDVRLGSSTPEKPELSEWKSAAGAHASTGTFAEAAAFGELLVLCCAGSAVSAVIDLAGHERFDGKILVDVTNPLDISRGMPPGLFVGVTDSLGEQVQRALPRARVVKCFNTAPAPRMTHPATGEGEGSMFLAGDDEAAKRTVAGLARAFGWHDVLDVGGIESARWLEALVPLWVRAASKIGRFDVVFRVVR
jgi:8-hydroxy-5-deazaflavin:NADPH oxidoreductase